MSDKTIRLLNPSIQEIIENELALRESIEQYLNINSIVYNHENFLSKFPIECTICPQLNYMSYLVCKSCKRKSCINHLSICKCTDRVIVLYYRFSTDLKYYSKNKGFDLK